MSLSTLFRTPGRAASRRHKSGWIGIDIGSASIKICQLRRSEGRISPERRLVIRAEDDRPFDAAAFASGQIGMMIRKALSVHGGFDGGTAACLISMSQCQLRTLVNGLSGEEDRREQIGRELLAESLPGTDPVEFEHWDAASEEQAEARGLSQVHVLSLARSLSDAVASNLLRARLQCEVLDALPFAAIRATEMIPAFAVSSAAGLASGILDLGHSACTLLIVRNGRPQLTRVLKHCGMQRIQQSLRQKLNLGAAEADTLLATCGVSLRSQNPRSLSPLQQLVTELCMPTITELMHEVQDTLSFLKLQFPKLVPEQFCLLGGGAAIRNIAPIVQQEIHLPAQVWNLPGTAPEPTLPALATAVSLSALAWES